MQYRGLRELNDERGKFSLKVEDVLVLGLSIMVSMFFLSFIGLELIGLVFGLIIAVIVVMTRLRSRPHIIRDFIVSKLQGKSLK